MYQITAPFRKRQIDRAMNATAAAQIAARQTTLALDNLRIAEQALVSARAALREHLALSAEIVTDAKATAGALEKLEPVA